MLLSSTLVSGGYVHYPIGVDVERYFNLWSTSRHGRDPGEDEVSKKESINELKDIINDDGKDADEIREKMNEVQQSSLKLFEMAYKKKMSDSDSGSSESSGSEQQTDAEYKDSK